jgi:L-2-hydroxyglutarate oxidase
VRLGKTEGHVTSRVVSAYDVVMVGAGILGLATARELHQRHPELRIAVLDKESAPGRHQSSHNSGVLHAGVYYAPGSLKARLCVAGKTLMEEYADQHGIPVDRCGKLIVALDDTELAPLARLEERARANGVQGLRTVGAEELREIEPHSAGIRALHSPTTGIIDYARVVESLAAGLRDGGVDLLMGHEVLSIDRRRDASTLVTTNGEVAARRVVSCAGLHSDRIAGMSGRPPVQIVPFRGDYYSLRPEARHLCRGLIYPVPDPSLPFLGVHFTKRVDGEVWAGPNAVLATAREGYGRLDVDRADLLETLRFPGFWKLARTYWRTGAAEAWRDVSKRAFTRQLQRYVPEIRADQLDFGPSGVRAQALEPDGTMVDDFRILADGESMHVLNAPSPAATASLAIARHLGDEAAQLLDLDAR